MDKQPIVENTEPSVIMISIDIIVIIFNMDIRRRATINR